MVERAASLARVASDINCVYVAHPSALLVEEDVQFAYHTRGHTGCWKREAKSTPKTNEAFGSEYFVTFSSFKPA